LCALALIAIARATKIGAKTGPRLAIASLIVVCVYWLTLGWAHSYAYARTVVVADAVAAQQREHVIKSAAMPTAADPFRWLSVVETDRAMYRFVMRRGDDPSPPTRYEKLSGQGAQLVSVAQGDRRAQILLGFARFPIERMASESCVGRTLVQFADLRYTEPGSPRGNFSVNIPVDCPSR